MLSFGSRAGADGGTPQPATPNPTPNASPAAAPQSAGAGDAADPALPTAGNCSTFRLDWIPGGPYNPTPLSGAASDSGVCSGVPDHDQCLAAEKGDGKQHPYLIVHDQGADGNCTFQATASVMNYYQSMNGQTPSVSPEFLAAQDCDDLKPGAPEHSTMRAISDFNRSGSCTRPDLANVANGGGLTDGLDSAYADAVVTAGLRSSGLDMANTNRAKSAICAALAKQDLPSDQANQLAQNFSDIADQIASSKAAAKSFDSFVANATAIGNTSTAAANGASGASAQLTQAVERTRCQADQQFFKALCQGQVQNPPMPPFKPNKMGMADGFKSQDQVTALGNQCGSTFPDPPPNPMTSDFMVKEAGKNDDAKSCLVTAMDQNLMDSGMKQMISSGKPLIIDVADMNLMVGKSTTRSDTGHAMVLIGRQMMDGQCGYWVRNSWGTQCPVANNPNVHCDPSRPGNIWISAANMTGLNGVKDLIDPGL